MFWSHILALHSVTTFAERVGYMTYMGTHLAGWLKLFQLAHLLTICAICRVWSQWFWLCTSICTLVRIMGLQLQCVSESVSKVDDPPVTAEKCDEACCALVAWKVPAAETSPVS